MLHELRAYLCVCVCAKSLPVMFHSLWPCGLQGPARLLGPRDSPGRILEWVAMPSSRESSWPRDQTCVSVSPALAGRFFTTSAVWEGPESIYGLSVRFHLTGILSSTRKGLYLQWKWLIQRLLCKVSRQRCLTGLCSTGLSHLSLNPSQLKGLDDITEKRGFICFFVAHQVNDLQPEKYVIRPWHDQRSCYILSLANIAPHMAVTAMVYWVWNFL